LCFSNIHVMLKKSSYSLKNLKDNGLGIIVIRLMGAKARVHIGRDVHGNRKQPYHGRSCLL